MKYFVLLFCFMLGCSTSSSCLEKAKEIAKTYGINSFKYGSVVEGSTLHLYDIGGK